VRFRGEGPKPADVVDRIPAAASVHIVDEDSPRMLLVDAPPDVLPALIGDRPDW
jgi:hypothetical protein